MAIPEGWELRTLGQLSLLITKGTTPTTYGHVYSEEGVPFFRVENITMQGSLELGAVKFISPATHELLARSKVRAGDLLFSIAGALGRVAMVPSDVIEANINQAIALIRIDPAHDCVGSYLTHSLMGDHVQAQVELEKSALAQANLNLKQIGDLSILLPPLPEQKKIAAILSSVDEVIAKTEAVIAQLQIVKKAMMEQLLTKGMPGRHTRFKQTEIGEIPEEWEVASVRDVAKSVVPGRNKPSVFDGTIPWLTIADLQHTVVTDSSAGLRVSQTELNNCGGKTVPAGTVIMSCVGRLGIVSISGCIVTMNQQLHGFACGPSIDPLFLCLVLRSAERQMQALAGKTTIPYLNKARCEEIVIPLPCLPEQRAVAEQIAPIETSLASEEAVLLQMRHLKSALSSSLLSGELRVVPEVA